MVNLWYLQKCHTGVEHIASMLSHCKTKKMFYLFCGQENFYDTNKLREYIAASKAQCAVSYYQRDWSIKTQLSL